MGARLRKGQCHTHHSDHYQLALPHITFFRAMHSRFSLGVVCKPGATVSSSQLVTASVGLVSGTVATVTGALVCRWILANSDEANKMKAIRKNELKASVAGYIKYGKELCSEGALRYALSASLRREWREHSRRGAELKDQLESEFRKEVCDKFGEYLAAYSSYGDCDERKAEKTARELEGLLKREIKTDERLSRRNWRRNAARAVVVLTLVIASIVIAFAVWALALKNVFHSSPARPSISTREERYPRHRIHVFSRQPNSPSPKVHHRSRHRRTHNLPSTEPSRVQRPEPHKEVPAYPNLAGQVAQTVHGVLRLPSEILPSVGAPIRNLLGTVLNLTEPLTGSGPTPADSSEPTPTASPAG